MYLSLMAAPAPVAAALYKRGDKLRVNAPQSSGLPLNATAVVATARSTADGWCYDVTLSGGDAFGSDVHFVKGLAEAWLRSENNIATSKACAPRPFGAWVRGCARLLVPLFQRRYCCQTLGEGD